MRMTAAVLIVLLAAAGLAEATPAIDVGTHSLQADLPGQIIRILVTGSDPVQGLELNAQIEDTTSGPVFTDGDVLTDTIFAGNHLGLFAGSYIDPRRMYLGVVTETGTVAADGLLAMLTVDTTDVHGGLYRLSLTESIEGPTNFAGVAALLTDGWIDVRPTPGDADCDGGIDDNDLSLLLAHWSEDATGDPDGGWAKGEFDGAAPILDDDLSLLLANWTGSASGVPEPATLVLLAAGAAALIRRQR